MSVERVTLLGVPLDAVTATEALERIRSFLVSDKQHHVVTPNSEMLVQASRSATFRSVLQKADLCLPDSIGTIHAAGITGQRLPERVTGVDTVETLLLTLNESTPVFLLGGQNGVADIVADRFHRKNPGLRVVGAFGGSPHPDDADAIVALINKQQPALLLVAYGSPHQDLWIAEHLQKMPSVRTAMGVGGTFDFLAKRIRRAPSLFRTLGIEWLWRLLRQPSRFGRIINAVIVFPVLVLLYGRGKKS